MGYLSMVRSLSPSRNASGQRVSILEGPDAFRSVLPALYRSWCWYTTINPCSFFAGMGPQTPGITQNYTPLLSQDCFLITVTRSLTCRVHLRPPPRPLSQRIRKTYKEAFENEDLEGMATAG